MTVAAWPVVLICGSVSACLSKETTDMHHTIEIAAESDALPREGS
jgi:hypothetical protein